MHTALYQGFQPIPLFPRPQWQLLRFIRKKLKLTQLAVNIIDWFVDHMGMDNKIICKPGSTVVKLLSVEFQTSNTHVCAAIRELVALDIIRKESSQIYVFNPYVVNRRPLIPLHAFGFIDKKIKVLEDKGFRAWQLTDNRQKKNIPSSRLRLQAANFRAMKKTETIDIPATHAEDEIMIANLQRQLVEAEERAAQRHQELIKMFKDFTDKHCNTPEAKEEAKCHLTLLQGGLNESTN